MTLAWAHLFAVMSGLSEDPGNALKLGHEAARNAIAADREDFWGYAVLGAAELLMQRHDSALSSVDHALELNPNNADARAVRASVLNFLSRPEEGLSEIKLAIRHNPHYPNWYLPAIGRSYYLLERYHDAIPYLERAVNLSPEFTSGRTQLAANYVAVGRLDEARTQVAALLKVIPDLTLTQVGKMAPFSKEEELNRFLSLLGKAGLPK